MAEQQNCQGCSQKDKCREIYRKPAKLQGRPMVFMAIIAFLLPIIVFVVSLAVFERAFTKIIDTKQLQMAISLLLAILSTLAVMLVAKVLNRQFEKNK